MCASEIPVSATRPPRLQPLPGFEKISRYWDQKHQLYAARIRPGEYYVSSSSELISTVLGSCISACIRDPKAGIGGMNHFMLARDAAGVAGAVTCLSTAARYGNYAMEHLINTILAHGGQRERLEIKLFGGGRMLHAIADIGSSNIQFIHDYLRTETLPVSAEDLGGIHPRKVLYFPASGRVLVRKLPLSYENRICERELKYQHSIEQAPVAGEIDLF
jgi:chemotaxis protein CheD